MAELDTGSAELLIWTDGPRTEAAEALLEPMRSQIKPIGVGGPRVTGVDQLAKALDCPRRDDLRQLIVELPAQFLLLASMQDVEPADIAAALAAGTTVLALEPVATDLQGLEAVKPKPKHKLETRAKSEVSNDVISPGRLVFVPSFQQCPGFLHAAEPYEALGDRRVVSYRSAGPAAHGSLFARLFDGCARSLRFTETPTSVDAALVGPEQVPDQLRELGGAMAIQARMPNGSAAVLYVADHAALTERSLHILGDKGELRISDGGYGLWQVDGTPLDQDEPGRTMTHPELVSHQWRRLIDRPAGDTEISPYADASALACCLACLLSARTAQPESPERVLQMNR